MIDFESEDLSQSIVHFLICRLSDPVMGDFIL